jgi:hypothetical protein
MGIASDSNLSRMMTIPFRTTRFLRIDLLKLGSFLLTLRTGSPSTFISFRSPRNRSER